METVLIKALQLVLSLSILVIVHEFGHFIFAKIFRVRVEKFYLFFNPWFTPFKYKPKNSETEYGIGWLPLGGYVKLSGMMDESMDKDQLSQPEQPWEFRSKPAWKRLLIMVGGVLMNFILAFFIYSMILFHWGDEYIPFRNYTMGFAYNDAAKSAGFQDGDIPLKADGANLESIEIKTLMLLAEAKQVTVLRNGQEVVVNLPGGFHKVLLDEESMFIKPRIPFVIQLVSNGTPAKKAGLEPNDSLVGIGERTDMSFDDLFRAFGENKNIPLVLNVYRNNQLRKVTVTPDENSKIGVGTKVPVAIFKTVHKQYGFFASFPAGITKGISTIKSYLGQFKYIFTKEGAGSLGGFGTIANIFPPFWDWEAFWNMTAFLSIILGVMNLLPIPALDGGHVMFLIYEVVTGRKPNDKFMEYAQIAGMIFLLGLLLYANGNDIFRYLIK
ncbi:zinc metalloprotease [Bacteroidia bacterium]|nr:zinc metalloprotease [Bacteroidia bacterium]GHU90828.1 zinc metalloprotease [Bacteroidia bacterium]GHV20321.1 zinc metalloprotease [Bacteroidia bacterium]